MLRASIRLRLCGAMLAAAVFCLPSSSVSQAANLRRLAGVDDVKTWFNANRGHVRAIFLLSPT